MFLSSLLLAGAREVLGLDEAVQVLVAHVVQLFDLFDSLPASDLQVFLHLVKDAGEAEHDGVVGELLVFGDELAGLRMDDGGTEMFKVGCIGGAWMEWFGGGGLVEEVIERRGTKFGSAVSIWWWPLEVFLGLNWE